MGKRSKEQVQSGIAYMQVPLGDFSGAHIDVLLEKVARGVRRSVLMSAFGGTSERIAKSNTVTVHLPPNFGSIARSRRIDSQFRTEWKQTVSSNWCPHLSQDHMFRTQRSCTCSDHSGAIIAALQCGHWVPDVLSNISMVGRIHSSSLLVFA
jgi:hypothetical protein